MRHVKEILFTGCCGFLKHAVTDFFGHAEGARNKLCTKLIL